MWFKFKDNYVFDSCNEWACLFTIKNGFLEILMLIGESKLMQVCWHKTINFSSLESWCRACYFIMLALWFLSYEIVYYLIALLLSINKSTIR